MGASIARSMGVMASLGMFNAFMGKMVSGVRNRGDGGERHIRLPLKWHFA